MEVDVSKLEKYCDSNSPIYTGTQRWELMNYLIKKYELVNYLEIGVNDGLCIRQIVAEHKDGVDPYPGSEIGGAEVPEINYPISSDNFFEFIKNQDIKYDMVFIDGLHHSEQVDKDIQNALKHITDEGFIILHDCNPLDYTMQLVPRASGLWNGDVWKSIIKLRCIEPNLEVMVVDTDWGVGVVRKGKQDIYTKTDLNTCLTWEYFDINRNELSNLITVEQFYNKF
jgi:hypothetical protein